MQKFPITQANQPDIAPRAAAFEASAKHQEHQLEPPELGGVLKELALARWRGLPAKPRSAKMQDPSSLDPPRSPRENDERYEREGDNSRRRGHDEPETHDR